jgi:non-ribosomal peptide synthetase component E (peptide arylation enzyme)
MQKGVFLAAIVLIALTACARETVTLKNPQTGQLVTCGPYTLNGSNSAAEIQAEHNCVNGYGSQGYDRVQTD